MVKNRVHGFLWAVIISGMLAGCSWLPGGSDKDPNAKPAPVAEARGNERPVASSTARSSAELFAERIDRILREAERALARDRLMNPLWDNAYDKYRAVLRMDPDNQQARSGLDSIVVRYLQLAADELAHSRLQNAQRYYENAAQISPDNPLLAEFRENLAAAKQPAKAVVSEGDTYSLAGQTFNKSNTQLDALLRDIAARVKQTDEALVIVAESDRDGRWIYQRLRELADGYRLRGDIQIGSPAEIQVQPPL